MIQETVQSSSPGAYVELYELDATVLGGPIYRFTSNIYSDSQLFWNGYEFTALPCESEGFEWSGKGALPRPKIKVANITRILSNAVNTYDDLVGATLKRIRTFKQYLDDGDTPDPTAIFPVDIYTVDRKSSHNKVFIEFELAAAMDQEGVKIPRRQLLKDSCTHSYRRYDATSSDLFDYTNVTCPYIGTEYFDALGQPTTDASLDSCDRSLSGCVKRFKKDPLPTRAFPGIKRY